jgi:ectoine hydrolase
LQVHVVALPFTIEEYRSRLTRIRPEMAKRQFDILLVNDIASQFYITGYDGWSFYSPQMVVVPMEGEPIWIGRGLDVPGGRLTAWMKPENIVGFPETVVQTPGRHPADWIGEFLADKGWSKARIGVEMDAYFYSAKTHARIAAALPNATFVDAELLVNWVRAVKSPAEIACMRKGATLVTAAFRKAFEVIGPGVRECDAVAAIQAAQTAGSADFAGDFTAIPPLIMSGENAASPHLLWSDRCYDRNETIALELGGAYRHYTAVLARTMQLGTKPKKVADVESALLEGMEAVLDAMRPGVAAGDVEAAWRKVLARHGYTKDSRIGYSIGIGYPPDWGEHTISLRANEPTILEAGNTIHAMIGMWMDGWGMAMSESVLVTETGSETLISLPRNVHHKP